MLSMEEMMQLIPLPPTPSGVGGLYGKDPLLQFSAGYATLLPEGGVTMPDNIASWIFMGLIAFAYLLVAIRFAKNCLAPVKKVRATVIDKNRIEVFSKYSGNGKRYKYAIVFSTSGGKLSFYVSEFSYGGYRKGETGTLTYKGDRLIDFS